MSPETQEVAERKEGRTFVRALEGRYDELYRSLLEKPRVYKSRDFPYGEGPVVYNKEVVRPPLGITQAMDLHIEAIPPGAHSRRHGHMNSAVMYVLEGKGYDIHDGERIDWEAGDAFIVENGCVHQHFCLPESEKPARILVMKAKPLFLFFHLFFQKHVGPATQTLSGWDGWEPEGG